MQKRKANLKFQVNESERVIEKLLDTLIDEKKQFCEHDIAIITLAISAVELAKEAVFLMDQKLGASLPLICRSVLEKYVYLKYILQDNTETRGSLFHLHSKIELINAYDVITSDTEKGKKIRSDFDLDTVNIKSGAMNLHAELGSSHFGTLEDQNVFLRNKYKQKLGSGNRKWHYEAGGRIRDVFVHVGMGSTYDTLYSMFSITTHGTTSENHQVFGNKGQFHRTVYRPGQMEIFLMPFIKLIIKEVLTYYKKRKLLLEYYRKITIAIRIHKINR